MDKISKDLAFKIDGYFYQREGSTPEASFELSKMEVLTDLKQDMKKVNRMTYRQYKEMRKTGFK